VTELGREDLKAKIKRFSTTATPPTATVGCMSSLPAKGVKVGDEVVGQLMRQLA
jgi:hypothetical protein